VRHRPGRRGLGIAAGAAVAVLGIAPHTPASGEGAPSATRCGDAQQPAPRHGRESRPTLRLRPGSLARIVLETNCGTIAIRLATRRAPQTSSSVAGLVRRGFYDGLTFHRVARGFVIQGGDPLGTGMGGPGYSVVERPPRHLAYTRGIVGMAKAADEPDGASGSQFFIVTARDAELPLEYALLGRVRAGMDTVDRIEALGPRRGAADGPPRRPVAISRATLQDPP
jgi:peptidyl-prolyl cis-trans isomerase B (cyclophilin B)